MQDWEIKIMQDWELTSMRDWEKKGDFVKKGGKRKKIYYNTEYGKDWNSLNIGINSIGLLENNDGKFRFGINFGSYYSKSEAIDKFKSHALVTTKTVSINERGRNVNIHCDINDEKVVEECIDLIKNCCRIPSEVLQDIQKTLEEKDLKYDDIFKEFENLFGKLKQGESLKPLLDKALVYKSQDYADYATALLALAQAAYNKGDNEFAKQVLDKIEPPAYSKLPPEIHNHIAELKAEIAILDAGSVETVDSKNGASLDEEQEFLDARETKAAEAYTQLTSIKNPDDQQKRLIKTEAEIFYGNSGIGGDLRFDGCDMAAKAPTVLHLVEIIRDQDKVINDQSQKISTLERLTGRHMLMEKQLREQSTQTEASHSSSNFTTSEVKEESSTPPTAQVRGATPLGQQSHKLSLDVAKPPHTVEEEKGQTVEQVKEYLTNKLTALEQLEEDDMLGSEFINANIEEINDKISTLPDSTPEQTQTIRNEILPL